jgi:ABC-type dipeptide/oligopeptide/nickel transport system ATPase component
MTIVNLRGPSGSGKTTTARKILEHLDHTEWSEGYVNRFGSKRPKGFPSHLCLTPVGRVWVHGRYDVQQGGCDTEKDMDVVERELERAIQAYPDDHHFFEGIMISKSKTRWFDFIARNPGRWVWAWMDTDPKECARRVMQRNGGKQINEQEIANGHRTMMTQKRDIAHNGIKGIIVKTHNPDREPWELFT